MNTSTVLRETVASEAGNGSVCSEQLLKRVLGKFGRQRDGQVRHYECVEEMRVIRRSRRARPDGMSDSRGALRRRLQDRSAVTHAVLLIAQNRRGETISATVLGVDACVVPGMSAYQLEGFALSCEIGSCYNLRYYGECTQLKVERLWHYRRMGRHCSDANR